MATLSPLAGWRYDSRRVSYADVIAPPPDRIRPGSREAFYSRHPANVIRLVSGRDFEADSPQDNVWTRAATHLDAWREHEYFVRDQPAFYLAECRDRDSGRESVGVACRLLLPENCGEDTPGPVGDSCAAPALELLRLRALRGHCRPVTTRIPGPADALAKIFAITRRAPPIIEVAADANVVWRLWAMGGADACRGQVEAAANGEIDFAEDLAAYRAAIAYRAELRRARSAAGQDVAATGGLESDWLPVLLVPREAIDAVAGPAASLPCNPMPAGLLFDFFW